MTTSKNNAKEKLNIDEKLNIESAKSREDAGYRILASGHYMSNDTRVTGLNNNCLVLGPSGAGKTRYFVKPNILQCNGSMVVADTKGNLIDEVGPVLENNGYRVIEIDFKAMNSTCRWNPLDYIPYDRKEHTYSEKDIEKISTALCPVENNEAYWDHASAQFLSMLISYTMDFLPKEQHTLEYAKKLFKLLDSNTFNAMIEDARENNPDSLAVRTFDELKDLHTAERTNASVKSILSTHIHCFSLAPALAMYKHRNNFRFRDLGKEKTALFVSISDTDRSMDALVSLFYSQALQDLCEYADLECPGNRLPIPVHFYLDDFATNIKIPEFDKFISVIRSRDISVSVILQSISQLHDLYGQPKANTVIDNCDSILYLGGQSLETAEYIGCRANVPKSEILSLPLGDAYLMVRGQPAQKVHKYDIKSHPRYAELPEAKEEAEVRAEAEARAEAETRAEAEARTEAEAEAVLQGTVSEVPEAEASEK